MQKSGFWSRIGLWLKNDRQRLNDATGDFDGSAGGLAVAELDLAEADPSRETGARSAITASQLIADEADAPDDKPGNPALLFETLQSHILLQNERARQVVAALDEVSKTVSQLPQTTSSLAASVSDVSRRLEDGAQRMIRLEQPLSQLPQLADAQREAMVSIAHQLDRLRQAGDVESRALQELHETVRALSAAAGTALADLKRLHLDSSAIHERMILCLNTQTNRLTLFAAGAFALALAGSVLGLIVLIR